MSDNKTIVAIFSGSKDFVPHAIIKGEGALYYFGPVKEINVKGNTELEPLDNSPSNYYATLDEAKKVAVAMFPFIQSSPALS